MIEVKNATIQAGGFIFKDADFVIETGQYAMLMGKTGSGKTTIMEAICGLKKVLVGQILLMGEDVTDYPPGARGVGLVPQDGALFSHLTIEEHLSFGLRLQKKKKEEIKKRILEMSELLGITYLLKRKPYGLSGGERQRVSLGRALAPRPQILCLDEPLSALDEETHEDMCNLLKTTCKQTGVTFLHVTHSPTEARKLGDIIFRIEKGKVKPWEISAI